MRKALIAVIMALFSYFLFTRLGLAPVCCCHDCNIACYILTGTECEACYSGVPDCNSSTCGLTTTCGDLTYYCCRTNSGYYWQDFLCSQSCTTTTSTTTSSTTTTTRPTTTTTTTTSSTTTTTTTTPTQPQTCDTRCKDGSSVEMYCNGNWQTYPCPDKRCDPTTNKCSCTSQLCLDTLEEPPYNTPDCVSDSVTFGCGSTRCEITTSYCGCADIASCCKQPRFKGKCVTCRSGYPYSGCYDTYTGTAPNCRTDLPWPVAVCCQNDSDCPAKDNIKGKCNTSTYTCYWPPCGSKSECVDGACCDKEVGGSGNCVKQGTIYNNKYLCDPPEWNAETQTKTQNVFELALNFLSHFFQR